MKIKFQTKEESNREQELAFLNLSSGERFAYWLNLMERSYHLGLSNRKERNKDNFIIIIPQKKSK